MLILFIILASLTAVFFPFGLRAYTALRFDNQIFTVEAVPHRRAALVFGAQVRPNGRLSAMLADRVRAGVDLYHAGKVDLLVMSGDNRDVSYNEPAAMGRFAEQLGVPSEAILLDPAGLRTYDSCYRAQRVFGLDAVTLVTQDFHLDRALLICNSLGVDAVGVSADYHRPAGYSARAMRWSRWREIAATSVALLDVIRRPEPVGQSEN